MDPIAILAIGLVIAVLVYALTSTKKGSSQPPPDHLNVGSTGTTSAVVNTDLWYGYFGCTDGQIAATKDHVNVVHIMDWCDYSSAEGRAWMRTKQISFMREAQAAGLHVILTVGYLVLTPKPYRFKSVVDLVDFKKQIGDLAKSVAALYLFDEPDGWGLPGDDVVTAITEIKKVWNLPVAVIYGDRGTPGIEAVDLVGLDKYGAGFGVVNQMPELRAGQRYILVPGGADPWRQDPAPFGTYAKAHAEVAWLCPFTYLSPYDPATKTKGIADNGMLEQYRAVGKSIVA